MFDEQTVVASTNLIHGVTHRPQEIVVRPQDISIHGEFDDRHRTAKRIEHRFLGGVAGFSSRLCSAEGFLATRGARLSVLTLLFERS